VPAALDSTDKRLTAPDPVGHLCWLRLARSRRSFSKCRQISCRDDPSSLIGANHAFRMEKHKAKVQLQARPK
jgi:hypothetical protein